MIVKDLSDAILSRHWHWYEWHAKHFANGVVTPFFAEVMVALRIIDKAMPGTAAIYYGRIASIGDRDRDQAHYDQLQQILAEIDVLQFTVTRPWPEDTRFIFEPSIGTGAKNPELLVSTGLLNLAVEVKSPRIREWRNAMKAGIQGVSRVVPLGDAPLDTLPRDNPIKDAVASADLKFRSLRVDYPELLSVLVLVWDELMNEPISALANPGSGLFTTNTFDPDKRQFNDLDAVLVLPHLPQLIEGPGNRRFPHGETTFAWLDFPVLPYLCNPASSRVDLIGGVLEEMYGARDQRALRFQGAEYGESDTVFWIDSKS